MQSVDQTTAAPGPPFPAWGPVLVAMGAATAVYAVTLGGGYVYDDIEIALRDPRIHMPGEWIGFFRQPYFPYAPDPLWRPLTSLSFVLHWRIHGEIAWPAHMVNVLLHAAVSGLVAVLAWRLTRSLRVMWLAGLMFAVHPVHVEAVAYLVGRAETLCALGVVGGLVLFLGGPPTYRRVAGIAGCFALALASKEHGLLLAPMLAAWYAVDRLAARDAVRDLPVALPAGRNVGVLDYSSAPRSDPRRNALILLFFVMCVMVLVYIVARESIAPLYWERFFLRWTVNPVARAEGIDRVLIPFTILGRYVILLVWPASLSPDYGANLIDYRIGWRDAYLYIGVATMAGYVMGVALAWRRRAAVVLVLLLWSGVAYLLISNSFYLIGISMGERLIYLTSVFVIILMAIALAKLPRRALLPVTAVLLMLGTVRAVSYAWEWNDELRLYSSARQRHPDSIQLHYLEAYVWYDRGELAKADQILARARQIGPEAQNIWALSSVVAELRGQRELADEYGARAHDLDVNPPHMPRRPPR